MSHTASNLSPVGRLSPNSSLRTGSGETISVCAWRGEGSYARVYRGVYSRTGGPCAVKVPKPEIAEARERLEREGEALAGLSHPHIVSLLDRGSHDGVPYLVLEWLDGETLRDLVIARRRLALRQSLLLVETVCAALAHLHARALCHGDVRPQNVLVVPGRGAVLTDPGAGGDAGCAEDVRAAGRLLHEMLTGVEPSPLDVRLTTNAGHGPAVVRLWESTQAEPTPTASEFLNAVRRLSHTL